MKGLGVSPGVAIGRAIVFEDREGSVLYVPLRGEDVEAELARLDAAVDKSKEQLLALRAKVWEAFGEEHAHIIDAHLLMLDDELFVGAVRRTVSEDQVNAEWALKVVVAGLRRRFHSFEDPYFQERALDVEDVGNRIQRNLVGMETPSFTEVSEDHILIARDLTPTDAALIDSRFIKAIALEEGGRTSHTTIIAKSLRIPAVVALPNLIGSVASGDLVIVDGNAGEVRFNPSQTELIEYRNKKKAHEAHERELLRVRDLPSVTLDGSKIFLQANIEFPSELEAASEYGAEGIGLYRSEFMFVDRLAGPPGEEAQYAIYRRLAERVKPSSAIVRTLDLGGGKAVPYETGTRETNPILGLRAIRYCLRHPELFKAQLRALLRASVHGRLKIMFPLISSMTELRRAKAVLGEAMSELRSEGQPFNEELQVGVMIEVPSAAAIADLLAREVSFFSIGTNDLIQFLLAVDRDNAEVSDLYQPLHPAVLRTLKFVVDAAHDNGIRVGLCGEMAGEPTYTLLLMGLGLDELSMTPASLPLIKKVVRSIRRGEAAQLVEKALSLATASEIEELVLETLVAKFPHGYLDSGTEPG